MFAAGGSQVWHYDGAQWVLAYNRYEAAYDAIWGTSPQDLFVAGVDEAFTSAGLIDHYDGMAWSRMNSGFSNYGEVYDLSGSSPTDAYAVGRQWATGDYPPELQYVTHRVAHYDGSRWTASFEITIQPAGFGDFATRLLNALWANARNDVFVVGSGGRIFHFDGATWSPMTSPTSQKLWDVWGNAASNVYAVGDGGILRYDGKSWTVINATPGTNVWGAGTDVFVISNGAILHGTP